MKIKLIAVGTKMPKWVVQPYQEYAQRLPRDCSLELIEIAAAKRSKSQQPSLWKEKEGELVLAALDITDWVVALDVNGQHWTTPQLAQHIGQWQQRGSNVALLVGGPDGLSDNCLRRANQKWALSALTFPHPLVRVIVAETIYRSWSVTVNHPYHRE